MKRAAKVAALAGAYMVTCAIGEGVRYVPRTWTNEGAAGRGILTCKVIPADEEPKRSRDIIRAHRAAEGVMGIRSAEEGVPVGHFLFIVYYAGKFVAVVLAISGEGNSDLAQVVAAAGTPLFLADRKREGKDDAEQNSEDGKPNG